MRGAFRPEYLLRWPQAVRRVLQAIGIRPTGPTKVRLAWGLEVEVDPSEAIGKSIVQSGVYDLPVTEVLWRLSRVGMTAVDVGANVGYISSILAARAGQSGHVVAIEPHPAIAAKLSLNAAGWASSGMAAKVEIRRCALGAQPGEAVLGWDSTFASNQGTARIRRGMEHEVQVEVRTLDEIAPEGAIELLKIDVEGSELEVIAGARQLLSSGLVRYVVVECQPGGEAELAEALSRVGFRSLAIQRSLFGPAFSVRLADRRKRSFEPTSFLAHRADAELPGEVRVAGWRCLRSRGHLHSRLLS